MKSLNFFFASGSSDSWTADEDYVLTGAFARQYALVSNREEIKFGDFEALAFNALTDSQLIGFYVYLAVFIPITGLRIPVPRNSKIFASIFGSPGIVQIYLEPVAELGLP